MKILRAIALASLLSVGASGQVSPEVCKTKPFLQQERDKHGPDMRFCSKSSRKAEVQKVCRPLALLRDYVKAFPDVPDGCFQTWTDPLNFTGDNGTPFFILATATQFATTSAITDVFHDVAQARPDRQTSAASNASGTTSLVSKAGSAELLSLALDTGVLTQSVNGTTATFTTNADQVFRLITNHDPDCTVTCGSQGGLQTFETAVLSNVTVAATVDLAQQNSTTVATSGQASGTTPTPVNTAAIPTGAGKISGVTARYQLLNKFDPRSDAFKKAWSAQLANLGPGAIAEASDTDAVTSALASHSPWSGLQTNASAADKEALASVEKILQSFPQAAKADDTGDQLVAAFERYWSKVVTNEVLQDPKVQDAVAKVVKDRALYRQAWFKAVADAAGTLLTFEYHYNHPLNQPYTNDFKIIGGYTFGTSGMLTFNGSVSLYGTIPVGAQYGRVHYGQVSAQYDRTMTGQGKSLQTQLSLAGYWQYQPDPSVLNIAAGTVAPGTTIPIPNGTQEFVGTAGSLWVTQAKLTIKGAGGINVPLGVSWSNKTDLLQGSRVGGQVGISYNFTSLAGLFRGGQ
jgi:hypothetical protein